MLKKHKVPSSVFLAHFPLFLLFCLLQNSLEKHSLSDQQARRLHEPKSHAHDSFGPQSLLDLHFIPLTLSLREPSTFEVETVFNKKKVHTVAARK